MFNFLGLKKEKNVYAPITGKCIDITEVNDIGFSSKAMGDGIAIIPESNLVCSPANGVIKMIFRTGHAFGIETNDGLELLVHIGIDTVNLNGEGFEILRKENEKIKKGDPIIKIDLDKIKKDYDPSTLLIVTNNKKIQKNLIGENVSINDSVLERSE